VISVIDSLRSFDLVNVMTKGGPFDSSQVLANYMYIKAFDDNRMGYGAAIAVVLFAISVAFIFLYLRQVMAQEDEGKA
jgi:ABC-type sugar transport system permease subunit